ncbi:hypothetical protein ABH931_000386 [Streptacidiphilus sp. MAP12-33]|uniref:hypothetical protein n=1 Tax=Streptacidiphilus sp. MAP12-33 TaxID=3156266 RepID=UPI003517B6C5
MAGSSPQGRAVVAKALRELARAGYYRVDKVRRSDGRLVSESHVYDTPQLTPGGGSSGPGPTPGGPPDVLPKDQGKKPSLPRPAPAKAAPEVRAVETAPEVQAAKAAPEVRAVETAPEVQAAKAAPEVRAAEAAPEVQAAKAAPEVRAVETAPEVQAAKAAPEVRAVETPPEVRAAVATLFRVLRPEQRLRLGTAEALSLAPLVAGWLDRGASEQELATALLSGLPSRIHAPVALLRHRLTQKLPPERPPAAAVPKPRWHECGRCADPVPEPGICRPCAGLVPRQPAVGPVSATTARGAALVRAALRGRQLQPG